MDIFLLILKIIGIVLLCIIGLVLLILAALLFAPFRYEIAAEGDKNGPTAHADIRVRWLLRIVSFRMLYDVPGDQSYKVKVFGITVAKSDGKKEEEDAKKPEETGAKKPAEAKEEAKAESAEKPPAAEPVTKPEAVTGEPSVTVETVSEEKPPEAKEEAGETETEAASEEKPDGADNAAEEAGEHKPELSEELSDALSGKKKGKLREKIDGLKEKADSLKDSLEAMGALFLKKKGLLQKYITKKSTKKAIKTAWTNAFWVLRHICPKKYHGSVEFGLDDPALTGEICAGISPWYPMISDYVKLTPNFEPGIHASGDLYLKGRIRLFGILLRAWRVYRDKNIRKVLREAEKVKNTLTKTPDEVKEIFGKAA